MTSFRHHISCLFSLVAGSGKRALAARGAALAGIGLALLASGTAVAVEHGEAEAAPPGSVEGLSAVPAPSLLPAAPSSATSPVRIVAQNAQLAKPAAKANSKPLFPTELPQPQPPQGAAATSPGPAPVGAAAAAKVKLTATKGTGPATPPAAAKRARLPLAPSAAEIRREVATRNGGPPPSGNGSVNPGPSGANKDQPSSAARLQDRATTAPVQNTRWPTHVDYSAGPTGPAGPNTAAERKGAMIEATGPQQGVIRNRW